MLIEFLKSDVFKFDASAQMKLEEFKSYFSDFLKFSKWTKIHWNSKFYEDIFQNIGISLFRLSYSSKDMIVGICVPITNFAENELILMKLAQKISLTKNVIESLSAQNSFLKDENDRLLYRLREQEQLQKQEEYGYKKQNEKGYKSLEYVQSVANAILVKNAL